MASFPSRSTLLQIAVFAVFSFIGVVVASISWRSAHPVEVLALEVRPTDLDLGEVWLQKELDFEIPISNRSRTDVRIEELTTSCSCTDVNLESSIVPAQGQVVIKGTIDLTRAVHQTDADSEPFEITVGAIVSAPVERTFEWPLIGTARRVLDVWPMSVDLVGANEVVSGFRAPTIELSIVPRMPLSAIKPEWSPDEADIELTGPDQVGNYQLRYTPNAHLPVGKIDTRVNLRTVLANGAKGPEIEIPVTGIVVPPVRLSPNQIAIHTRSVDTPATSQSETARTTPESHKPSKPVCVHVLSLDDADWRVVGIVNQPDWLSIDYSDAPLIQFELAKDAERMATAEIQVVIAADERQTELPFQVNVVPNGRDGSLRRVFIGREP